MKKRIGFGWTAAGLTLAALGCATASPHTTTMDGANGAPNTPGAEAVTPRAVTRYNSNGNEAYTGTRDAMYSKKGDSIRVDAETLKACGNLPESHFAFDSATLNGSSSEKLDSLAWCFREGALHARSLSLIGHTDPRGGPEYNKELGRERAESVAKYLAAKGVKRSRISVASVGEAGATGQDEAAWAADRVVDVKVTK